MSVTNSIIFEDKYPNSKEKQSHESTLECLKECSNYNLLITCHQRNINNYSFFSKISLALKNNIFLFNNVSSNEIIQTIAEKSIIDRNKDLLSYNYRNLFNSSCTEIDQAIKEEIIQIPLESEDLNLNFVDFSKNIENYTNHKGLNLLIKFDLNDKKDVFVFDKYVLYNILSYKLNAKLHGGKMLLEKDIFFLMDIKKIIKSIQIRLEYLQKQQSKDLEKLENFFVPLLEYENVGLIISSNYDYSPLNINKIKTNFNSIVKQKFELKSILIALNISSLYKNENLNIENLNSSNSYNFNLKKIESNKDKNNDNINDETTSESSNYNSNSPPKFPEILDRQVKENLYFNKINTKNPLNNSFILSNKNLNNNYLKKNENNNNSFSINNNGNKYTNRYFKTNNLKKYNTNKKKLFNYNDNSFYINNNNNIRNKYSSFTNIFNINTIIFNSNDIFSKTLFNRYQDKSNSTCNLKILIEFLKIQMKKSVTELTIYDFFYSFYKISSLSLKIPFFKKDGTLINSTLTPSLHELNLYIKNPKFMKKIEKKLKINKDMQEKKSLSSFKSQSSEDEIITKNIDGFIISIFENSSLVKITYKENKPYYLTESLYDKLENLMNKLKYIKKLNIEKNILLDKSYISIEWNIINGNNIFSSSFISYHLFNGSYLGILSDIKEKEESFWLNSIEEINNKRIKVDYNYLIKENYCKIYDFINNSN